MTIAHAVAGTRPDPAQLSAMFIDGITEAVALPADRASRAAAVMAVVRELYDAVAWVHAEAESDEELASLARVLAETQHHQDRMRIMAAASPVGQT